MTTYEAGADSRESRPTVTESDIVRELRAYIAENFLYARPDYVVGDDDHLLEKGVVDSMGMVELLTFLQDRFGVEPADEEITEENFATLGRIASYVRGKLAPGGTAAVGN